MFASQLRRPPQAVLAATGAAAWTASMLYQRLAENADRRRFPPPGRLVDVGGRYLHVADAGSGSPAVVVIPELSGNVISWLPIQEQLAKDMRVCLVDRAGCGWSDPPPRGRRTIDDIAAELRQLLDAAGIEPGYLLVGHSFGGVIARRFAARYPAEMAGLILVDSSHEQQGTRMMAEGPWQRGRIAYLKGALRYRCQILGLHRLAAAAGISKLHDEIALHYPPGWAGAASAIALSSRQRQATVLEYLLMAGMHGEPPDLGDLPLTVLTAANREPTWVQMQVELSRISSAGKHIVAEYGGHHLQRDNPHLVTAAIRELQQHIAATSD